MIKIKLHPNYNFEGNGEIIGKDLNDNEFFFSKYMGEISVPTEVAIMVIRERPQRYILCNKDIANKLNLLLNKEVTKIVPKVVIPPKVETKIIIKTLSSKITKKELKNMTKDQINDWAAKRDYDVDPSKDKKDKMIVSLIKQINKKTGIIVK